LKHPTKKHLVVKQDNPKQKSFPMKAKYKSPVVELTSKYHELKKRKKNTHAHTLFLYTPKFEKIMHES